METIETIETIERSYQGLSKGHKAIADFILKSYDKAAYMTAAKLGEEVGVSESTVVRFTTELGFEGYPQFQKAVSPISPISGMKSGRFSGFVSFSCKASYSPARQTARLRNAGRSAAAS